MQTTVASTPQVRRLGVALTLASLAAIGIATLFPDSDPRTPSHFCLTCGSQGGVDAILNVVLFAPLGIGLGLLGARGRLAIPAMCALSALIETTQFFFIAGRDGTISDLVTNTLGGALGFSIGRYAFTLLRPSPRIAFALSVSWSAVWLAIQAVSAFGFSPAIPSSEYYGQIARRLGNFEQFRGRVVRASIANVIVPDTRFEASADVRELLIRGATITTTIVTAGPTRDIAPIVRVADDRQREIALLAQDGEGLIFRVRTGADVLRLRPLFFALPDLFPAVSPAGGGLATDTLTVSARYSAREVRLSAQTVKASYDRRIPITASLGWTLVLPFQWFIEGTRTERVVSGIWIACLLIPIGYWQAGFAQSSRALDATRIRVTAVPSSLALIYVALVVVPRAFGVTASPPRDWLAAVTGILSGALLQASVSRRVPKMVRID